MALRRTTSALHVAFAGIALEYGTYPLDQVLQAFRAEHWLHNHPDALCPSGAPKSRRQLRDMFYVDALTTGSGWSAPRRTMPA